MIGFKIISSAKKEDCCHTVSAILDKIDEGIYWNLKESQLPVFEEELKQNKEANINFKAYIVSLDRFSSYGQYLTSFYVGYGKTSKPVWSKYVEDGNEDFLHVLMDDNSFSVHERMRQEDLNFLTGEMKKFSLGIANTVKALEKNYILIGPDGLIDSYDVKLKNK